MRMKERDFDKIEFEMNKREFITHVGKYKGKKITVLSTGMGPDNIEIFFTELDALVNIDLKKKEIKATAIPILAIKIANVCIALNPIRVSKKNSAIIKPQF